MRRNMESPEDALREAQAAEVEVTLHWQNLYCGLRAIVGRENQNSNCVMRVFCGLWAMNVKL